MDDICTPPSAAAVPLNTEQLVCLVKSIRLAAGKTEQDRCERAQCNPSCGCQTIVRDLMVTLKQIISEPSHQDHSSGKKSRLFYWFSKTVDMNCCLYLAGFPPAKPASCSRWLNLSLFHLCLRRLMCVWRNDERPSDELKNRWLLPSFSSLLLPFMRTSWPRPIREEREEGLGGCHSWEGRQ